MCYYVCKYNYLLLKLSFKGVKLKKEKELKDLISSSIVELYLMHNPGKQKHRQSLLTDISKRIGNYKGRYQIKNLLQYYKLRLVNGKTESMLIDNVLFLIDLYEKLIRGER